MLLWEKLSHKNAIKVVWGSFFGRKKNGGGFWPFLAGKRAVSDSELLETLTSRELLWKKANSILFLKIL